MSLLGLVNEALDQAGFRHKASGGELIAEMERSLTQLCRRGIMPEEIYSEYARSLSPETSEGGRAFRSLILVAAPAPPVKVSFDLGDRKVGAVIPPTYLHSATRARTLEILKSILGPQGYRTSRVPLPVKLLAVRTGLAKYGRNGLAYVDGFGSFARLDVYGTDADLLPEAAPVEESLGRPAKDHSPERLPVPPRMNRCLTCAHCFHACPTGCISSNGDRIDPLRCLTFLNEHEDDWPDWLSPGVHNSLVGCMVCQRVCPMNAEVNQHEVLAEEFDRAETDVILQGLSEGALPEPLRGKLGSLDMGEYSKVLGRNLRALSGRSEGR